MGSGSGYSDPIRKGWRSSLVGAMLVAVLLGGIIWRIKSNDTGVLTNAVVAPTGQAGATKPLSAESSAVNRSTLSDGLEKNWLRPAECAGGNVPTLRSKSPVVLGAVRPGSGDVVVGVFDGGGIVDRKGADVLVVDGQSVELTGEGLDAARNVIGGDAVVLVTGPEDRFALPFRISSDGQLSEVELPSGALGAWEIESLPGGGAVVAIVEKVVGESADVVNAWRLDANGSWKRLTDLVGVDGSADRTFGVVEGLRQTASGMVFATIFRADPQGTNATFSSQRLMIDPGSGQALADVTAAGELLFDRSVDGRDLVGVSRVSSVEWYELGAPRYAAPIGCESLPSGASLPDPDVVTG